MYNGDHEGRTGDETKGSDKTETSLFPVQAYYAGVEDLELDSSDRNTGQSRMISVVKATERTPIYLKREGVEIRKITGPEGQIVKDTEPDIESVFVIVKESNIQIASVGVGPWDFN